jgi:predicted DNA-binding transcriptional regulator AlpA
METTAREAPILVRIPEGARRLGIGKTAMYARVVAPRGPVPIIKIGAAARVRLADLEAWAAEQAATAREAGDDAGC